MESVMNPTISSSQQSPLLLLPSICPSIRVFSNESVLHIRWYMLLLLLSRFSCVRFCVTPQMAAHLAPPSLGFSRQEYRSGLPFPSPMHAWMLSHFSRVWLYVNPWTAAHQMVHSHMHMRTGMFVSYHLLTHTPSFSFLFSSVQSLCRVQLFATPWNTARQSSLSITNSQSPPKSMSIESVIPNNHLILRHSLVLLPSIFPSIRVFTNESALCIRCLKYRSLSFSISPSNEYSRLIFFRIDWLDLLAVQGTLKNLL